MTNSIGQRPTWKRQLEGLYSARIGAFIYNPVLLLSRRVQMPSQSISFSPSGWQRLTEEQPEDMSFSEWVETLALEGLNSSSGKTEA